MALIIYILAALLQFYDKTIIVKNASSIVLMQFKLHGLKINHNFEMKTAMFLNFVANIYFNEDDNRGNQAIRTYKEGKCI